MLRYMCTELDPLFKPVIDGRLLKYSPDEYLRRNEFPTMPYMTGTVRAEFGKFIIGGSGRSQLYVVVFSIGTVGAAIRQTSRIDAVSIWKLIHLFSRLELSPHRVFCVHKNG